MYKIFHHDDLDGVTAAAVVLSVFPEAEYTAVNYGDVLDPADIEGDDVFIVDFSFENMPALAKAADRLVWIDHHITAAQKFPNEWTDDHLVHGKRQIGKSGALLTWEYMIADVTPIIIDAVNSGDLWDFKDDEVGRMHKAIVEYLNAKSYDPADPIWITMFDDGNYMKTLTILGNLLLDAKMSRVLKASHRGKEIEYEGHKTYIVNAPNDISELGAHLYNGEYDVAIMYQIIEDRVVLSFRSNTVNVRELAEALGGGGHDAAAGAGISLEQLTEILK